VISAQEGELAGVRAEIAKYRTALEQINLLASEIHIECSAGHIATTLQPIMCLARTVPTTPELLR
jgi:hypothetical protein